MMGIAAAFVRLATQAFLYFAVALILFFLPEDALFRLSSWSLYMGAVDIAMDVALMVVLLALLSATLAVAIAASACLAMGALRSEAAARFEADTLAVSAIVAVGVIALVFARILKTWLQRMAGDDFPAIGAGPLIYFLVILVLGIWIWRAGPRLAADALRRRLARGRYAVLALIVLAGSAVASRGVELLDPREIRADLVSPPRAGMPNVILLSIDTLSAVDMSLHGYRLPTTPKLEAFARESYVFDNFFAASNWTLPSVATMISGLHPLTSGVYPVNSYFGKGEANRNLARVLEESGYQSAAIVANARAHPIGLGIEQSFSAVTEQPVRHVNLMSWVFDALLLVRQYRIYWWIWDLMEERFPGLLWADGETESFWPPRLAFERALGLLGSLRQPWFVWIHILPPHDPYLPARAYRKRFGNFEEFSSAREFRDYGHQFSVVQRPVIEKIRMRYDEFVLDTDAQVGDFLESLRAQGTLDDSIVILTSDHGESFTRGYLHHGGRLLHQPLVHVPFIVRLPGQKEGRRVAAYAGHVDLLPTVMDLLELPIPLWAEGESLKPALSQGKPATQPKFSMNLDSDSRFAPPGKGTVAVMHDGWKLVRYLDSGYEELYQLSADPAERDNVARQNPAQAKRMREMIYARFKLAK